MNEEDHILKIYSKNNKQAVFFFGAKHTNNPNDEQFIVLEKLWGDFFDNYGDNSVAICEGLVRKPVDSFVDAIKSHGESGAIQWFARKNRIEIICGEPASLLQREYLCKKFDKDDVAYAIVVQRISGWFRGTHNRTFSEVVNNSILNEIEFEDIYGFMPTTEWFYSKHKNLFSIQNLEDKLFIDSITDPRTTNTIINSIISTRSKFRNDNLLSLINKLWKEGKSIFIVYGNGHLVVLRDSLKKILA